MRFQRAAGRAACALLCLLAGLLAVSSPSRSARAQDEAPLDFTAAPSNGSLTITGGFSPDPTRARIIGGGPVNSVSRALGDQCVGYIALTPHFSIDALSGFPLLRLIFISDALTVDTTLIVRDPAGRFFCNNNFGGLFNPMVSITDALPGTYAVWVGGFTPSQAVFGDLYTTTNAGAAPGTTGIVLPLATSMPTMPPPGMFTPVPPPGTAFDAGLAAVHGEIALATGFLPDPFWRVVVAGGSVAAPTDPDCVGYAQAVPDIHVRWSSASTRLRMMLVIPDGIEAGSTLDLALVVRDPSGRWHCAADWAGGYTEPLLEILNPLPGDYAVWATVENGIGAAVPAIFYMTEITDTIETVDHSESIPAQPLAVNEAVASPDQTAAYGMGFDPLRLPGISFRGGDIDVGAGYPTPEPYTRAARCVGLVPIAPNAAIVIDTPQPALRIFFQVRPDAAQVETDGGVPDPVLIAQMPDGRWYCADDAAGSKDAQLDIIGNLSTGTVQVWVGGFSNAERFSGTLTITRADYASATPLLPDRAPGAPAIDAAPLANTQALPLLDAAQYIAVTPDALAAPTPETAEGSFQPQGAGAGDAGTRASDAGAALFGLDPAAAPNYGEMALVPGFGVRAVSGIGGGDLLLTDFGAGVNGDICEGFVSAAPDLRVQMAADGPGGLLRVFFMGNGDSTLIVRAPDGTWYCGDDQAGTLSPQIDIANAAPGAYALWIGSYEVGGYLPGVLTITSEAARTLTTP